MDDEGDEGILVPVRHRRHDRLKRVGANRDDCRRAAPRRSADHAGEVAQRDCCGDERSSGAAELDAAAPLGDRRGRLARAGRVCGRGDSDARPRGDEEEA